jgi:hypothetical protein
MTYKEMDATDDCSDEYCDGGETEDGNDEGAVSRGRFLFSCDHPGKPFCYLVKLKHPVIPKIFMTKDKLCDVEKLDISNSDPSEETIRCREDYAKYALMLFYPFRTLTDLQCVGGSYWTKFQLELQSSSNDGSHGFWFTGKQILQNMQDRLIAKTKMKRPDDPLFEATATPASLKRSKKRQNGDETEEAKW